MDTPGQVACGIAAVILAVASVEGKIEASVQKFDPERKGAILAAFQNLIHELRDRAGIREDASMQ